MLRNDHRISFAAFLATFAVVVAAPIRQGFAILKIGSTNVVVNDANYVQLTNANGGALATEICSNMIASAELFTFANIPNAQAHFRTRANIVATINKMVPGGAIDFGIVTTSIEYPGTAWWMPRIFKATQPTLGMRAKPGVATSAALDKLVTGRTRSDCEQAQIAAVVIGHRMEYGNVWIDGQIAPGSLVINSQNYFTETSLDQTTYIPGDVMYMTNKDDYKEKVDENPNRPKFAVWMGENTIYAGGGTTRTNGKFDGLGIAPMTEAELRAELQAGYIADTGLPMTNIEANMFIVFNSFERIEIQP